LGKRWKNAEREVARRLGGTRVPITGRKGCDIVHPYLGVEVKSRASIGIYLWDFLEQAEDGLAQTGESEKIPVAVIHRPGMDYDDALLLVRLKDFPHIIKLGQVK